MAAVIPAVTRISSRIIRVLGCNPGTMTLQGTNTYIVGTGKRWHGKQLLCWLCATNTIELHPYHQRLAVHSVSCSRQTGFVLIRTHQRILIDTGDSDVPQYINHLRSVLNYEGIDLAHIFISHWHHDHIGGLTDIFDEIKDKTKFCQVWKYPRAEDELPKNVKVEPLKDGQEFAVEGATLRVVHTPGHTEDHIIFHLLEDNAVFSGDCILGEGTAVFEDLYDYMNSLREIGNMHPSVIYPGHGNVIQNPMEKIQFYITHRLEREQQIVDVLSNNKEQALGESDLVKMIYIDIPEKLMKAAEANVNHHLVKLLKEQRVRKLDGLWQINDQKEYIKTR